jgi:hypothetical protein
LKRHKELAAPAPRRRLSSSTKYAHNTHAIHTFCAGNVWILAVFSPFFDSFKADESWEFEGEAGIGAFSHESKSVQFAAAT